MGYNIRSITSFFFHLASSFSTFLVNFSIRHLISSSSPASRFIHVEYERNGVAHLLAFYVPFENWRRIDIADNHAAEQWAQGIRRLVQEDYPQATREEHREARERKRRAGCAAPRVGVGLSIWSESGA